MRSKLLIVLAAASLAAGAIRSGQVAAQAGSDLPDIGSPANAVLTEGDEYRIGAMIVRGLRDQNQIIEDPEINEYLQAIGGRLAAQVQEGGQRFNFFVVRDPAINAFALPGGFIGIHHGLLLATRNESELASVLAHEIAHVTQRHIARMIQAQGRQNLTTAAAVLAAILIGAVGGASGDAMQGAIAAAQGVALQQRINFTRANEYEADRVGIGILAAAGFKPDAMADFFETMGRRTGLAATQVPELLRTHPVTTNRIAESRSRAAQLEASGDTRASAESLTYELARERVRVLTAPREADMRAYYARRREQQGELTLGERYGEALALVGAGEGRKAARILHELWSEHPGIPLLAAGLAQAQMAGGLSNDALATFEQVIALSPRNVPITVRYAEALMASGRAKEAHALLLDLFNNVPPTPEQIRLTALAASSAGDTGDAYYYMSEYHIASGDLPLAAQQLELALAAPNLTSVQRQRFEARLAEIREVLLNDRRTRRTQQANTSG